MNISILILWLTFIKSDLTSKRLKIVIIRWLLNYKLSLMKSKLNVRKFKPSSRNSNVVLLKMLFIVELVRRYHNSGFK